MGSLLLLAGLSSPSCREEWKGNCTRRKNPVLVTAGRWNLDLQTFFPTLDMSFTVPKMLSLKCRCQLLGASPQLPPSAGRIRGGNSTGRMGRGVCKKKRGEKRGKKEGKPHVPCFQLIPLSLLRTSCSAAEPSPRSFSTPPLLPARRTWLCRWQLFALWLRIHREIKKGGKRKIPNFSFFWV